MDTHTHICWKRKEEYKETLATFYADDGLLEHKNVKAIQTDLDEMVKLFERVGLKTNEVKTKWMIVRGPGVPDAQSNETYNRIRRGTGKVKRKFVKEERLKKVECEICGSKVVKAHLQRHMKEMHGVYPNRYLTKESPTKWDQTFNIQITRGKLNNCPIPGCTGGSKDKFGMYRHFCLRHVEANLIISGDGQLDRCSKCGIFAADMEKHTDSATCKKGATRRTNEEMRKLQCAANDAKIFVYGKEIERVSEF